VDAKTNTVIWRGWAQDSVEDALDNHERMERLINEAVRRMMERFPRGGAGAPMSASGHDNGSN
jgi:hypothetical protein